MNGRTAAVTFVEGLPKLQQPKEESEPRNEQPNKPPDAARLRRHFQPIALSVHFVK